MTESEIRIVRELWFKLHGRIDSTGGSKESQRFLHRCICAVDQPMDFSTREGLMKLAWQHRDKLPRELAVLAALSGGAD